MCVTISSVAGLLQLVCVATSNPRAGDVISNMTWKVQARGVSILYLVWLNVCVCVSGK